MFSIYDGRQEFYQFDTGRKLIVADATINEVHFCNRTKDYSLIREVYDLDGARVVDVPDILLTDSWRITVYGYDINYTKFCEEFKVVARTRPDDYVYGEEELRSWDILIDKVEQIEREGFTDEQVEKAVSNYLIENPIDMEGYATDEELTEAIAAIPEVDLSDYALKSEIPSTSGLATESYVDDKIANLDIPEAEVDLSNYYTKREVDSELLIVQNNIKRTIPTTTSALTNDSNFQTDTQVNAAITTAIGAIEFPETDLSDYALKSEIPEVSEFQTEAQVIALIEQYGGGGEVLVASEGVEF